MTVKTFLPRAAVLAAALLLPAAGMAQAGTCEQPRVLRVSLIPQDDVRRDTAELQPLLDALRSSTGIPVETYLPSSYGAVVEGLLSGAIHLARLGPATYVNAKREDPQLTAFASYARKANAFNEAGGFYYSLLVVRADSAYDTVASLRGQNVALVDPGSTSGALVPRRVFALEVGGDMDAFFGNASYTGSHLRSVQLLLRRQVEAAFVGSTNLAAVTEQTGARAQVRVLWRSGPIPGDPFVYRGQLCDGIQHKIRDAFLGQDTANKAALLKKLNGTRFVPVADSDYQVVREIQSGPQVRR
jgi:phosphonate transport system substrate-binding protein